MNGWFAWSQRDQVIVTMRDEGMTRTAIARTFRLSVTRIRAIEADVRRKIGHYEALKRRRILEA